MGGGTKEALNAALSDAVCEIIFPCKGYVTKDSNGIFLLTFPSADNACGFIINLSGYFKVNEEFSSITIAAGIHYGMPTTMCPNKLSGRADYLGPPVNASARLMALAGDKRAELLGDRKHVCVLSLVAKQTAKEFIPSLSPLPGKFSLKGVTGTVE